MCQTCLLLGFLSPSPTEMMLLVLVALLLYGGDLPKVARSWGKSLAELRKGLTGLQNEINEVIYEEPRRMLSYHEPSSSKASPSSDETADSAQQPSYPEYSTPGSDYSGDESVVNSTLDGAPPEQPADEPNRGEHI